MKQICFTNALWRFPVVMIFVSAMMSGSQKYAAELNRSGGHYFSENSVNASFYRDGLYFRNKLSVSDYKEIREPTGSIYSDNFSPELSVFTSAFQPLNSPPFRNETEDPGCYSASACPNAGNSTAVDICYNQTLTRSHALTLLGADDDSGTFSPSLPRLITSDISVTYTIPANGSCPEVSSVLTVNVVEPPNAGLNNATLFWCGSSNPSTTALMNALNAANSSDPPDTNGVWTQLSADQW